MLQDRLLARCGDPRWLRQLWNLSQRLEDLVVRRPFLIVYFYKLPTNYPLPIDDVSRWMRPALAVRIQNAIAINNFMVFILEHGKVEVTRESVLQFLHKLF